VIDAVRKGGTAVINADDERCLEGAQWARGDIIYFTMDPDSRPVRQHVREHGVAYTVKDDYIVMRQGHVEAQIIHVADVPITFEGHARFNVANALAAAAAAHGLGLNAGDIQMGLQTFHPTPGQNPGRTNLIDADGVKVLIDYGHNVPALEALDTLVSNLSARRRICVASAPGNRRDEDIYALGAQIGKMHDMLFVCETHPRGRELGEAAGLVKSGADAEGSCTTEIVMGEEDAVERALDEANEGDLLVLLIDDVDGAIERIRGRRFSQPAASDPPGVAP
jgi:cyanophycin synthetase